MQCIANAALDPTWLGSWGHNLRAITFKLMPVTDITMPLAAMMIHSVA
jgi:hypothetical protein